MSDLDATTFADVALLEENEVQGLPHRQHQKLKAVSDFLIAGNDISADTTMIQIISTLRRKITGAEDRNVRQRVDGFLGPAEIDDTSVQLLQRLRGKIMGSAVHQSTPLPLLKHAKPCCLSILWRSG